MSPPAQKKKGTQARRYRGSLFETARSEKRVTAASYRAIVGLRALLKVQRTVHARCPRRTAGSPDRPLSPCCCGPRVRKQPHLQHCPPNPDGRGCDVSPFRLASVYRCGIARSTWVARFRERPRVRLTLQTGPAGLYRPAGLSRPSAPGTRFTPTPAAGIVPDSSPTAGTSVGPRWSVRLRPLQPRKAPARCFSRQGRH